MGRTITIIVVIAAVCIGMAAPAAALTPDGTLSGGQEDGDDGDTTLLPWSNSSSNDGNSTGSDSSDDRSSAESSGESSNETGGGAAEESSNETSGDSSETDGTNGSDAGTTALAETDPDESEFLTAVSEAAGGSTESESFVRDTIRSSRAIGLVEFAIDVTNGSSDLEEDANGTVTEARPTVSTTTDTVDSLEGATGSVVGTLESQTRVADAPQTSTESPTAGRFASSAAAATGEPARGSFVGSTSNLPGSGPGEDVPPGPATGVALGLSAVALGAVARQGSLMPGLLAGLGSTLSAGVAPVAGGSSALERLVRAIAPFRYSRYDDSDPLEHEARSDVFEIVKSTPGAYLSEVAERADLPLSTARHHVRILEREDLLSGAKVRGKRRFYPAYTNGVELAAAMNDDATAAVLDAIARLGAASVSDLADDLGRDPSTISHHLQRLEEDEIIVRERDGRAVMNKLAPEARTALVPESDETDVAEAGEAMASD